MMTPGIGNAIKGILEREGSYVNHPADRGGPTNHGITQGALTAYLGRAATIADVRDLTIETAANIYVKNYWVKPGFDRLIIPPSTQELLFDMSVNHGPDNATKMLQRAVGALDDGDIGPKTRAAIAGTENITARLIAERVSFYGRIITNHPDQAPFAAGWANRSAEFIRRLS